LTTTEANNIQAAITTSNGGSPPTNLCWNGSPIIDEGTLTSAVNSGTIDILVGLNWNNGAPIWSEATKTAISAALHAGTLQKLLVYDRFANNDVQFPGLEAGSVVLEFGVEPIRPIIALVSPNVGPAGTVGTWSACWSNHGYIVPVVPLSQAEFHYERVPDTKPVSVQFCHNDKLVYYSTTPQDAYLDGYTYLPVGSANMLFANTLWKIATEFCCVPSPTTYRLWNSANNTLVGTLVNGTSYCIDYPYNIEAQDTCPILPSASRSRRIAVAPLPARKNARLRTFCGATTARTFSRTPTRSRCPRVCTRGATLLAGTRSPSHKRAPASARECD